MFFWTKAVLSYIGMNFFVVARRLHAGIRRVGQSLVKTLEEESKYDNLTKAPLDGLKKKNERTV
jgi:hypothetical protein